ncbi:MAG TPA: type II secretion system F family protein [Actinocrinis sp.]|uniref:type II secretion system F family protein n=1 Tax=Actinocrinis sp. TaxID=1920516 RepID=UPI002DDD3807|nr:type II secretion system F family protein [Actinocrinis sp.]HEV2342519.1 type II secretion system F family protein [Actinocrinis sp.]
MVAAAPPVVDLFAAGLAAGLLPADAAAVTATAFIGRLNGTTFKHDSLKRLDTGHPLTRRNRFALIRSQRFTAAPERGSLDRLDAERPLLRGGYLTPIRSRLFGTARERGSLDRIGAAHPPPRHDRLARIRSRLFGAAPECRGLDQVNAAHPVPRRDRLAFFRSHRFGAKPTPAVEPTAEIARRFAAAAQALRRGADPETAWSLLAVDSVTAPVAAAALRASRTGAPAAETVSKAARDLWRAADQAMQTRVRSVAVRATVPLALCFLPAFILIGVMPTALGLLAALRP